MKILVVMDCPRDGYWDTSGHCHWEKPAIHRVEEFGECVWDDDEEAWKARAVREIAEFLLERPKGTVDVYRLHDTDDGDDIGMELLNSAHTVKRAKEEAEAIEAKRKADEERARKAEEKKKQELAMLKHLKGKYDEN